MKILFVGELNPDLVLQGYHSFPQLGREVIVDDCLLTMGSATAICAVGAARLGNEVSFCGKAGRDVYGDFCVALLEREHIDTHFVLRDETVKTGLTVSITGPTDRALVTYPGAIVALKESDVPDAFFEGFRHLHTASYFLQDAMRPGLRSLLERASRRGLTASLDPGFDPSEKWGSDLLRTLECVDVFFPNEVELTGLTGETDPEAALRKLENGRTLTVAKLGRAGAMALDRGRPVHVPAFPIEPVDTTGAGDSFNAGFLHCWLRGGKLTQALRFGAACGALSTRGFGGTTAQPSLQEAEEFLA